MLILSLVMCVFIQKKKKERKEEEKEKECARDLGRILKVAPVHFEITLGADKNTKKVRAGPSVSI